MANFEPQFAEAIKEFNARLGDELSIKPGEIVEVIADDREFNDGWYMGKNLVTNLAGLYPKSFTKPIQNPAANSSNNDNNNNFHVNGPPELNNKPSNDSSLLRSRSRNRHSLTSSLGSPISSPTLQNNPSFQPSNSTRSSASTTSRISNSPNPNNINSNSNKNVSNLINNQRSASGKFDAVDESLEVNPNETPFQHQQHQQQQQPPQQSQQSQSQQRNQQDAQRGSHSSVIKTMSEIDQALEDFKSTDVFDDAAGNAAGYSLNFQSKPVLEWSPLDVGDYFKSINYYQEGLQFQKHKITGQILLELELAYLKELDIGPFGTRFEIFKIIENLRNRLNSGNSYVANVSQKNTIHENSSTNTKRANSQMSHRGPVQKAHTFDSAHSAPPAQPQHDYANLVGNTYTMDNPYLNASTDNFSENGVPNPQFSQQEDSYSFSSNSELMPPMSVQESSKTMSSEMFNGSRPGPENANLQQQQQEYRKSFIVKPKNNNVNPSSPSMYREQQQQPYDDRQFSPVRKAPLPPSQQSHPYHPQQQQQQQPQHQQYDPSGSSSSAVHSPKMKKLSTDFFSSSSPSTPISSGRIGSGQGPKHNFIPFSAGSRIPDSPILQSPDEEFSKLNLINESVNYNAGDYTTQDPNANESVNGSDSNNFGSLNNAREPLSPLKYRSASANETIKSPTFSGASAAALNNKRAVSNSEGVKKSIDRPPINPLEADGNQQSESSFKVTQVRNAHTSKTNKKTKKQTSAFQEGINRVTPESASKTSDYSGWMSKKSSSAVGPWKQRFFTLHGTRLSYFGSMKDIKEKGLIDITAHRVLPARDDDKLVSLYAATTGQGRFCFKLVPPAPGSKKGLTFTQPKVHYFAVETREEMRNWMVALMKATIDLDDTIPTVSTCSTPTVSLQKAQELLLKARENAKAREEQLKAKGFLQPGVNDNKSSPILENGNGNGNGNGEPFDGFEPPVAAASLGNINIGNGNLGNSNNENSSLSPAESSSVTSSQSQSHTQNSQQTASTNSNSNNVNGNGQGNSGTPKMSSLQEFQAAAVGLLSPKSPKASNGNGNSHGTADVERDNSFRNKALGRFKKN